MRSCPRCRRANPPDAIYCHHDGIVLGDDLAKRHASGIPEHFARDWRFPSGRRCTGREELIRGTLAEWDAARVAYVSGNLGRFLQEISNGEWMPPPMAIDTDDDIALQGFLEQLAGVDSPVKPVVELSPRRLQIDAAPQDSPILTLRVSNRGEGYLYGTMTVGDGCRWIEFLTPTGPESTIAIRTRQEQTIQIRLRCGQLPSLGCFLGRLILQSNGGTLELPVAANLVARTGSFHGYPVTTHRELAKVLRDRPKDACRWLEDGSVARWFADHGVAFPVQGPLAPGMAGVQQLFEALGVGQPPQVRLDEREIQIVCQFPEEINRTVLLVTSDKKWVYAFIECAEYWLRLESEAVAGPKEAEIRFTIDSSLLEPDNVYETTVRGVANAGQQFALKVTVDVRRPHEPFTRRILKPFLSK